MSEQNNIDYIYQDTNEANFQLVSEDIVNTLVNIQNQQNAEVAAWFLA
tara:strand:- start:3362 stop:3505 length:144 start_codon:yes stop_codon:yes gene_type:complete